MVFAIKHGESDLDLHKAGRISSVVMASVPVRQPLFRKLTRGAKQSSAKLMQKYNHMSQPRRSSAHDTHRAMVQRFQLRRMSTGTVPTSQQDGSSSMRHRSSLIISSLNFNKQIPIT